MPKTNALRRFFLPCFHPPTTPPPPPPTKKRISTSLRDDIDDITVTNQETEHCEDYSCSPSNSPNSTLYAPPRPSRTMVIGTIFGHRRGGHIWFCIQQDRTNPKPSLFLELSMPTSILIQEMQRGLVRIALEFNYDSSVMDSSELSRCPLHSIPLWTLFCNGRQLGYAVRRKVTQQNRNVLKTMQNVTYGAGVIPGGSSGFGPGTEEVMYMRTSYEYVVGSADSESFHLINPESGPGQELSVFLLRTK